LAKAHGRLVFISEWAKATFLLNKNSHFYYFFGFYYQRTIPIGKKFKFENKTLFISNLSIASRFSWTIVEDPILSGL
jgi:hypothetical protein